MMNPPLVRQEPFSVHVLPRYRGDLLDVSKIYCSFIGHGDLHADPADRDFDELVRYYFDDVEDITSTITQVYTREQVNEIIKRMEYGPRWNF